MAAVPPGGSGTPVTTGFDVQAALRGRPLTPPPGWTTNGTYGRCTTEQKPQQVLSQGELPEQTRARLAAQRRQMNTIGLWFGGVATGGGAFVRLIGGNEAAVESAAKATWDIFNPGP